MSSGDFGMELRQSVQAHLETIQTMAAEAKARIASGVAAVRPAEAPRPFEAAPAPPAAPARTPRYTVSFDDAYEPPAVSPAAAFDDDPAFVSAALGPDRTRPAVSFDDLIGGGEVDGEGIPVWEDPP